MRLASRLLPLTLAALALTAAPTGAQDEEQPVVCTDEAVRAAVAAGGNYVFRCTDTVVLNDELVVTKDVSFTTELPPGWTLRMLPAQRKRLFRVTAGTLTLEGLTLSGGGTELSHPLIGCNGPPGTAGCDGALGAPGQGGGDGGAGTDAEPSQGACFHVAAGGALVIRNDVVEKCIARGGDGMYGGDGGFGSNGEHGDDATFQGADVAVSGESGGSGSRGGHGGNAGDGGNAEGGAIYNLGTLTVVNSTFKDNLALGGNGGQGGRGGLAGSSGDGGNGGEGGGGGSGGSCGAANGGNGGNGGDSGDAAGGAIYNAGKLTVAGTGFTGNKAIGAGAGGDYVVGSQTPTSADALGGFGSGGCAGGDGGVGDAASGPDPPRPQHGTGGSAANGGNGGNIGDGGDGFGGAIFNTGQMDPPAGLTFAGNVVEGGRGWNNCIPQTVPDGDPQCPAGQRGRGGAGGQNGNGEYPEWHPWYEPLTYASDGSPGQHGRGGADGEAADPDLRTVAVPPPTPKFKSADVAGKLYGVSFDAGESVPGAGTELAAWTWKFGDGRSGTGKTTEHAYKKPGIYKATLTVRDALGQEASLTKDVEVRPQLDVTLKAKPSKIEVEQTKKGPKPVKVALNVTVKNPNPVELTNVRLPQKVEISLPDEPEATKKALSQKSPPTKKVGKKKVPDLDIGTLKKGESETRTYELVLKGDGAYEVEALVTGAGPSKRTVKGVGKAKVEGSTPLLYFQAKLQAAVRSQKNRKAIEAGTPFLIRATLSNRSYVKRLVVYPIYAQLDGNAADGHMQLPGLSVRNFTTTGSLAEVRPSKYIELAPRAKKKFDVVVRTLESDAWATQSPGEGDSLGGGTRARVGFNKPKIGTVSLDKKVTRVSSKKVLMGEDSEQFEFSVDDSVDEQPPAQWWEPTFYGAKGIVFGLWNLTYGTVAGVFELGYLGAKSVIEVPSRVFSYVFHTVELWYAIKDDEVLRRRYINQVLDTTATVVENVEYIPTIGALELYRQVDAAINEKYTRIYNDLYAGNWRRGLTEWYSEATERTVDVALALAPGILARMPATRAKWQAITAAKYARIEGALVRSIRKVTEIHAAIQALRGLVRPGLIYTNQMLAKLYGLRPVEADWLRDFTKNFRTKLGNRISVVLRSRAEESIRWIDEHGALLKPYWIKMKNVNWIDAQYLGYSPDDVGRLILRHPPAWDDVIAKLRANKVKTGSAEFEGVRLRWEQRNKEWFGGDRKDYFDWHKKGEVEGKWPWEENGVDPTVQADEIETRGFRLKKTGRPGEYALEIRVKGSPDPGDWRSVTGDIDLIAITRADGRALTDAEHVEVLKEIRDGPMGALHPESATWIKKGEFWFPAKENYLTNEGQCCLAQFAADGNARAVDFNADLSEFQNRGKHNYRIWWNGGYQSP
jgi:hypothetical protein